MGRFYRSLTIIQIRIHALKTLVLGIGNLLLGDEGVGVHAARELLKEDLPQGTRVLEIGTAILDALPELEKAQRVIVLDAMTHTGDPGTIYQIPHHQCRGSSCIASMHGFDLFRTLALTGRTNLPDVLVLGVEPSHLDWSTELSAPVAEALPLLLETVRRELNRANNGKRRGPGHARRFGTL
jgi:hydrogenase maturation protease